jgi:leucine dehydrogenase
MSSTPEPPSTARGCLAGIAAAVGYRFDRTDLAGVRVAVQGLGNVGRNLCGLLAERGVELVVSDVRPDAVADAVERYGAVAVDPDQVHEEKVDVFAPCALGAVIDDGTAARVAAPIVAGAANNQLADERRHGAALHVRGILYAPDYVMNAGGMIQLAAERSGTFDRADVRQRTDRIGHTLLEVFARADLDGVSTSTAAAALADERIAR